MLDIIKCDNCGHYQENNDEPCHKCKADFSLDGTYTVIEDQERNQKRFKQLGEKGFNDYMESIDAPQFMICPNCRFKMLRTETQCPKCGVAVKYMSQQDKKKRRKINLLSILVIIISLSILFVFYLKVKNEHLLDFGYSACYSQFVNNVSYKMSETEMFQPLGYSIKKSDEITILIPSDMIDDIDLTYATLLCRTLDECALNSRMFDHTDSISVYFCEDGNDLKPLARFSITKDAIKQY